MRPYKKFVLSLLFIVPKFLIAQDSTVVESPKPEVRHEFGINCTMLLKQVFNLSNNTFTMLPYDVTYKRIVRNSALRFGLGATIDYSKTSTKTTNSGSSGFPGPDESAPIYHHAYDIFFRAGWEKRFPIEKRFLAYAGFDLAGHYGASSSQTATVFNNLPTSYSYQRSTASSYAIDIGGGPVAGIQFAITNRLSVFTEIPLYVFYSIDQDKTTDYSNFLQFNSSFVSQTSTSTDNLSGLKFSITLPVTLYLAVKF